MWKVGVVVLVSSFLLSACNSGHETLNYQYAVRGTGEGVQVRYFAGSGPLVEETVSLPWTSEEYKALEQTVVSLEADGPEGTNVECVIRRRSDSAEYGGNGSGESTQSASGPDEDATVCELRYRLELDETDS